MESVEKVLERKGVRPTSNRILVLKALLNCTRPVNLADLEQMLQPMDKASIFRVLELFSEKDVVHVIEDGSRTQKYELCHGEEYHTVADQHVHFYCEQCRETYCLESVPVPAVAVPDGYDVHAANYLLKGICPKCRGRK